MSTLTSPGLLSPPAPVYICLQPDDTHLPASPTDLRRARDAMQGNAEDLPMLVERRYFHDSDAEMAATAREQLSLSPAQPQPKRNKRKNFQPRNIVCDAPESDCDCEAEVPTASAAGCGEAEVDGDDDDDDDDDGAGAPSQPAAQRRALDLSCSRTSPEDAPAMKEYAENTMKELLSIYGLSGADMAETITKNVPIANFSSGKILETLSLKQPAPQQASPPTPPRTPFSPPPAASASTSASSASSSSQQPGAGSHPLLDTLRHKAALLQQPRLSNNAHHVPQVSIAERSK
ncbi:uncharacterized protein LOC126184438 [Schistocerca cancellata]|uniref:uncharacterized protein LOC126184438 n=1 Tax=Schistocerca cancellata TaxID=274614 RepID=UPI002118957A|nr:uncharacterized protein LOC126184438 [Schistocerca cancellata]